MGSSAAPHQDSGHFTETGAPQRALGEVRANIMATGDKHILVSFPPFLHAVNYKLLQLPKPCIPNSRSHHKPYQDFLTLKRLFFHLCRLVVATHLTLVWHLLAQKSGGRRFSHRDDFPISGAKSLLWGTQSWQKAVPSLSSGLKPAYFSLGQWELEPE